MTFYEEETDEMIGSIKQYPMQLSNNGRLNLNRKQIFQTFGRLWMQKHELNLHSELLDQPEFFEENYSFLTYFQQMERCLNLRYRISVINNRLNMITSMLDLLNNEIHAKHQIRLERIIIMLIALEVILQLMSMEFVQNFFSSLW